MERSINQMNPQPTSKHGRQWKNSLKQVNPFSDLLLDRKNHTSHPGNVKSIGVSNFSVKLLNNLLQHTTVVPAVNQVQLHPMLPQNDLLEFCNSKGIHLTAYMPLGRADSPFFTNDQVKAIADKNNTSVAQILLSWGVQRGTSVIPKSVKEERLKQNLTTITLSEEDFQALNNFHKQAGMHRQLMITPLYDQEKGTWMTWTHEQMGWNWDKDGNVLS
ncbi:hypothetical protein FRC02_003663 [Tulasnella sp. 418]|nr:hypothetical protein FRC02_003663 [Tulasnella sp. 418]